MLLAINGKEVAGAFCLKEKTNQKEFRSEKVIKKKDENSLSNGRLNWIYLSMQQEQQLLIHLHWH